MRFLNSILVFFNAVFLCNGCLPNPAVEGSCPALVIGDMMESSQLVLDQDRFNERFLACDPNPCSSLSGTLVTVSSATVDDCTCVYSVTATCDVSNAYVEYNGAGPTFPSPETLICYSATSQYTYTDGAGIQQQISSIQCTCNPNTCAPITATGLTVSADMVDANCVYTVTADCTVPGMMTIVYNGATLYGGLQTWTCDTTTNQWTYLDFGLMPVQIMSVMCAP